MRLDATRTTNLRLDATRTTNLRLDATRTTNLRLGAARTTNLQLRRHDGPMFVLESVWRPAAPVTRVWPVLADPGFTWPDWWPGLTALATHPVVGPDGLAAPGAWARLQVRSPLGYALRFRLDLVETREPRHRPRAMPSSTHEPAEAQTMAWPAEDGVARLRVSGDLVGSALVTVSAGAGGQGAGGPGPADGGEASAEVSLRWEVAPVPTWFRAAARIGPGPLAWAHAHVMRAGERGLTARLRR
ncbi:hypothetical protein APR04_000186 [Promicromonospora umidemergens]|uniref:Polyketide cyclase/dehydrase/lipid transport protein n=1 Tax=Promicromonospora umidemergens TaxID=629679 RepID=A0ABP8X589_9MICO|nr:hypothetical protein [Promicromonospora umidemergens]MCP2281297.1 hypothetical protein [Promicromonospora umidemergens]